MLISKWGLCEAEKKLEKLREKLKEANAESNLLLESGGDNWHDNPTWRHNNMVIGAIQADIYRLEEAISDHELIDELPFAGVIIPGAKVSLRFGDDDPEEIVILGTLESDPDNGIISSESPLAVAILGKKAGETATFNGCTISIETVERWSKLE